MKWKSVKDELPKEGETVWITDIKSNFVTLGALIYCDGWMWSISNGDVYAKDGSIVSDCELEDDYDITHWIELPKLPK